MVIFLENGARAFLGGNSRISFVTAQGSYGVNCYISKLDDFVVWEMAASAFPLPAILAKKCPITLLGSEQQKNIVTIAPPCTLFTKKV